MPRYWSYEIGDRIRINSSASDGMSMTINKKGVIFELLDNVLYDYRVKFDDYTYGKYKESEIDLLVKIKDVVKLKSTGEEAFINFLDEINNQAELKFKDGSYKVLGFDDFVEIGRNFKVCKVCNEEKHYGEYYLQRKTDSKGNDYIYCPTRCRECDIKINYQRNLDNIEETRKYQREWAADNPDRQEGLRIRNEKYRKEGKQKKWRQNNTDKTKGYNQKRRTMKHEFGEKEWLSCKTYFNNACAYCGMTYEEHKSKYNKDLHREHVDCEGSNKLDNCVPACIPCNTKKRKRSLEEWYNNDNPRFNAVSLRKIGNWLNGDYKLHTLG